MSYGKVVEQQIQYVFIARVCVCVIESSIFPIQDTHAEHQRHHEQHPL